MLHKDEVGCLSSILVIALCVGGALLLEHCDRESCRSECASQWGSDWHPRTGMYESCTCVGPDGEIKGLR